MSRVTSVSDVSEEADRVAEFLLHMEKERDVSPNTLKAYGRDLAEFTEYLRKYYGATGWS
ncbi:MAG: site-specific integrase, partial [Gemmatimonadaceae bacterium]